ncbi:hypothetical protein AB4090_05025 [Acidithiobacillus sp. IBUN Pt1247-S3]|uniref:hypothetical protein n=1 Tax=Acidithiobacillus sp. IBUN Pt1247-S3 TaxID=3166642 RepID=UPI0034E5D82C
MNGEWDEAEGDGFSEESLAGQDGLDAGVDPEDTVDPLEVSYRLSVRISPTNPFHQPIVGWLSGFSRDNRGMRDIGAHLVKALLLYLEVDARGGSAVLGRGTGPERFAGSRGSAVSRSRSLPVHVQPPLSRTSAPVPASSDSVPVSPAAGPSSDESPVREGSSGGRSAESPSRKYGFFAGGGDGSGDAGGGW